jgi:hypothetical protein
LSLKRAGLVWAGCHLFLIFTVSSRDIFHAFSQGGTLFPSKVDSNWAEAEHLAAALLTDSLPKSNGLRQVLGAYVGTTGIDAGYSFFAPHVPASYKLTFELHYADGRVEYQTLQLKTRAGQLRIATLLDLIGNIDDPEVRKGMIKFLVHAVWRDHPDVSLVRVVFGTVNFPTAADFARGQQESYRVVAAYDVTAEAARQQTPAP